MRIIGGTAGGTLLKVPKGLEVRPTPDLVRQAVFNSLGERVIGARVLELFGGTAALSLECLSRGSIHAVCVEKAERPARMIRTNLALTRIDPHTFELRIQDAFTAIQQLSAAQRRFDLILANPPYGDKNVGTRSTSFAQRLLDDPHLPTLLNPGGRFVLGHTKRDTLSPLVYWEEFKFMRHGDTVMRFLGAVDPDAMPDGE